MLEKLVNEDRAGAEELFHEIVVEKSREIYENLLENDLEETDKEVDESSKDEEATESTDEETKESSDDEDTKESADEDLDEATDEEVDESSDDEEAKEGFDMNEFEVEPMPEADPADDMMADLEMGDGEEGDDDAPEGDEDLEDRMVDLEKELDDLRQQFNDEMGGGDDEGDDEDAGDMGDMDADDEDDAEEESIDLGVEEATDEEATEATDEEVDEAEKSETETMREYVEKVTANMGDNGANTKSTVASANDMGGDASNLVAGGEADSKGTTGGLEGNSAKEDNMGNINVPGGKAAKSMKAQPKGHGAEKKSAGETADNKKSTIGS